MIFRQTFFEKQYFLLLLPVFFLLHGIVENYPLIAVSDCLVLFGTYLLATIVIAVVAFLLLRSWRTAAMLSFFIMAFHFFFGPAHDFLKNLFGTSFITKYSFLLPFILVAFVLLIIYLKRKKPDFYKFSRYINVLLLVLILIDLSRLAFDAVRDSSAKSTTTATAARCESCERPDIYLIIADEYAGKKELDEVFHFDNSAFYIQLRNRGFFIVDSSFGNYNYTPFSMASMLSMNYLDKLEGRNKSLNDRNLCYRTINSNALIDFFKSQDYELKNCSIFQFAGKLPFASTPFYMTGVDLITAQTFLSRINRDIRFNLVTRLKIRSETERALKEELRINEELYKRAWDEATTSSERPRFVYTHLEMPHYPYYFDRNGKPNQIKDLWDSEQWDLKKYIGYLQYANKKYLELIDHILKNSEKPPVVIFMSDHGFREFVGDSVDHGYHYMNINSIHLPNKQYQGFYKGMSNVNQFRVLLNTEFKQNLPMLKDSTIFLKE
ncbi:MAG: sulfatase-like hydrolase/transferase [Flavisolibacter sp.]